jgi:hypothetical protein
MNVQTLIQAKYAGELDSSMVYSNLGIQTIAVLIAGIVFWRVSNLIHQRKLNQRAQQPHFKTRFSEHWKNR